MAKDIEEVLQKCFNPKEGKPNLRKIPIDIHRARQITQEPSCHETNV